METYKVAKARVAQWFHGLGQFFTGKLFRQGYGCCDMVYSIGTIYSLKKVPPFKWATRKTYGLACTCGKIFYVREGYEAYFWLQRAHEAQNMRYGRHRWYGI
jgi:hypothetical protein